jgi:hypothetical protein
MKSGQEIHSSALGLSYVPAGHSWQFSSSVSTNPSLHLQSAMEVLPSLDCEFNGHALQLPELQYVPSGHASHRPGLEPAQSAKTVPGAHIGQSTQVWDSSIKYVPGPQTSQEAPLRTYPIWHSQSRRATLPAPAVVECLGHTEQACGPGRSL